MFQLYNIPFCTTKLVYSVIDDLLSTLFQQKNKIKKGKYPDEIQKFTFFEGANEWFGWREGCIDFEGVWKAVIWCLKVIWNCSFHD